MNVACEHVGLAARDPDALKGWYERVLGARTLTQLSKTPPAYLLEFTGGLWLEIYGAEAETTMPEAITVRNRIAGWRHLALRVENIEAAQRELMGLGVNFSESIKPAGGAGRVVFFSDPEGNLLHLVERPANWTPRL